MAHHMFTRRAGEDSAAPAAQVPRRVLQRRSNPAYKHIGGQRAPQTTAAAAPLSTSTTTTRDHIEAGQPATMRTTAQRHQSQQQHSPSSEPEPLLAPTVSLSLSLSPSGSPAPSVFSSTSGGGGGFDSLLAHHMTGDQQELAARRRGASGGAEYAPPPRLWMLGRNASGWGGSVGDAGGARPMRKLVKDPGTGGSARPSFSMEIPGEEDDGRRRGGRPRAATSGPTVGTSAEAIGGAGAAGGLMRRRVVDRLLGLYRRGDR